MTKKNETKSDKTNGAIGFWKSDSAGRPANGGSGPAVHVGLVQELAGKLPTSCGEGAFHATLDISKWNGERLWVVAMYGETRSDGSDKFWGMKREFLAEVPW